MVGQRTLKNSIRATGVGLHTGKKVLMTLRPGDPDTGLVFRRTDLPHPVDIRAQAENVGDTTLGTSGPLPPVTWAGGPYIGTLFLVATPNQGTFTALKCLEKGTFYYLHHGAFSPGTLFTFPSATDRLPWGYEAARPGAGPNMLRYGWTVTTLLIAAGFGIIAMMLPSRISGKTPLALVCIFPIPTIRSVIYSLMPWGVRP